jgi:methyltransferase
LQSRNRFTLELKISADPPNSAQSHDQKTYLAGTIARALAVFCVDEVIIFEDEPNHSRDNSAEDDIDQDAYTAFSHPSNFLAHILSYLETPAYLRKALFTMHPNLRTAGTLPSLDMPHHLRANEWCEYREGVTVDEPTRYGSKVDVGLPQRYTIPGVQIPPKTRVTLHLDETSTEADAVAPTEPKEEAGYYWGYAVRRCPSLSTVFTECPYDDGYDASFGTSERGEPVSKVLARKPPEPEHMLVVFGGVAGLEVAAMADPELGAKGIDAENVGDLFDYWLNVLPGQGSRTIRTEEAVWLGLMGLRDLFHRAADG